ncbi:ATP-binding protein [Pseudodesulfovibrio sp. zrk46]|uniref:ATP-binding protein n=1 Tax=Pseudodesulfovibrio sp. zrk46 TaxID=2725288 RepID=UPI001449CD55|nr:ATP-binding protein [Pseudodesulfovibrio sp. zrk46]QJB55415.1 cell wall metabolism sensor histidine kinase WalK [Pseudodesulfovibrio sp. zrk46]
MPFFKKSLILSIGAAVLLVECLVLTSLGLFYTERFSHEVDANLERSIKLPGELMNRQLLRYESVEDDSVMKALIGEEFLDAMVIGADGRIYYSNNPGVVGESIFPHPDITIELLTVTTTTPVLIRKDDNTIVSITPLVAYEGAKPFFHVFIKADTKETAARKGRITLLFILGSAICVMLTSLAIIGYSRKEVIAPLVELTESADAMRRGEDVTIPIHRKDEIGKLATSFNAMNEAINQKIHELEEANEAIGKREHRLAAFIQAMPDLVFIIDKDGRYEEAYSSDEGMLLDKPEDLKGKLLHDVMPKDMADRFLETIRLALETGETQTIEYNLSVPSGTIWFEARTSAIGGSEEVQGSVWLVRDITYRKEMEQRLTRAKEDAERVSRRLRELDETKSALVSSVSHELRTPLTSLLGFSQLILKNFSKHFWPMAKGDHKLLTKGAQIVENLNILIHEGNRLTRLINDVLDLNKIEQGHTDWRKEIVHPGDLARRAVSSVSGQFHGRRNLTLITAIDDELPDIEVDSDRMLQVLLNLLSNAAKFTQFGTVTLKAFVTDLNRLRFEVIDTGPGIAPRERERIFDAFHQAGDTVPTDDKARGAGLGLAICRDIVTHYHGSIWVESEVGEGSTFIIELPLD